MRDDRLSGLDVELAAMRTDAQHAAQHDGEFVEFRLLARLGPALWAAHMGNADGAVSGVHASDVFVDQFGLGSGGGDAGGLRDQSGHLAIIKAVFTTETQRHRGRLIKRSLLRSWGLPCLLGQRNLCAPVSLWWIRFFLTNFLRRFYSRFTAPDVQ